MQGDPDPAIKTVAMTGATGFIGATLRDRLEAAGYRVRALYRPRSGRTLANTGQTEWVAGNVDDATALARLCEGADAVIHCAGAVRGASRADFDRVNVDGTRAMVEAAAASTCQRFLLLSSLAAREPQLSDYAGSKRSGEQVLRDHAGQLAYGIIRPPAVYGPGDKEMLPLFKAMQRGLALIPGDGQGRVSLVHVDDLAAAMVAWVCASDSGAVYEVDDGRSGGYDWDAILDTVGRVCQRSTPIRRLHVPKGLLNLIAVTNRRLARWFNYTPMLTPGKVRELTHADWVCDSRPLTDATGWSPRVDLAEGVASILVTSDP